jgi:hypothetical protein
VLNLVPPPIPARLNAPSEVEKSKIIVYYPRQTPRAVILVRFLRPRWMRDWIIGVSDKSNLGIWALLWRKRYIDEKLTGSRNEIEAVVNLGAGFDTRPYRRRPCLACVSSISRR